MIYPEVLLLPIFMFADYFLTVAGAIQKEKRYDAHFKTEHYELNPLWQKQIAKKKWFNLRHTILTILVSAIVIYQVEYAGPSDGFTETLLGFVLVLYGMVLGRHLSNLLVFRHLVWKPDDISGQVTMSHQFVLSLSLYQSLMVMIPIGLIAFFSPSSFAIGGAIGVAGFLVISLVWVWRARRRK